MADRPRIDPDRRARARVQVTHRDVAGAGILQARSAWSSLGTQAIPALAVGIGVAAVVGYASIAWFIKWIGSHQLVGFAVYRVAAGCALLAALASGYLRAR
ncbi:MAG: hypothetical protein NT062_18845 [Proteobacteria bacterium]|nr:hypothetical protein [Pseudomonadota bacterium]